jgi:hypothetical protein
MDDGKVPARGPAARWWAGFPKWTWLILLGLVVQVVRSRDPLVGVLVLVGVFGLVYATQAGARRGARARAAARDGGGTWTGRISPSTWPWLWPELRPSFLSGARDLGLPVHLAATAEGLRLTGRGIGGRGLPPLLVPWSQVAGARGRDRGFDAGGGTLSLVRLAEVTVDLVGMAAEGWRLAFDLDHEPEQPEGGPPEEPLTAAERAEFEKYVVLENGPDWRPGTAALRFVTSVPDGLAALVTARASGVPVPVRPAGPAATPPLSRATRPAGGAGAPPADG